MGAPTLSFHLRPHVIFSFVRRYSRTVGDSCSSSATTRSIRAAAGRGGTIPTRASSFTGQRNTLQSFSTWAGLKTAATTPISNNSRRRDKSSWAAPHKQPQQSRRVVSPSLRQRRPLVNGEAIAFHIRDYEPRQEYYPDPLLPPNNAETKTRQINYESDLKVILDMDECLLHSIFLSSSSQHHLAHQVLPRTATTNTSHSVDTLRVVLPDNFDEVVQVQLRPGVLDFLDKVTQRFETHIFTAAVDVYAQPVLDQLDPHGRLAGRWYRESCTLDPEHGAYVKALGRILRDEDCLSRVVLVDNNPLSFLANPENGILVSSFYNDPTDTTLKAVWELLEELDGAPDVRPILTKKFDLPRALENLVEHKRVRGRWATNATTTTTTTHNTRPSKQ